MYTCQHFFVFSKNKAIYFEIIVVFENVTVYFKKVFRKEEEGAFKGELFSKVIDELAC